MTDPDKANSDYIPFSQRAGLEPIPPQLKLGEVSAELRRLIDYYVSLEIDRQSVAPYGTSVFRSEWLRTAQDLHVLFFQKSIATFEYGAYETKKRISDFISRASLAHLFNFVEFLVSHSSVSSELKIELAEAFVRARSAYRIIDQNYIVALGSEEERDAYLRAIDFAAQLNAAGARKHLVDAAIAMRHGQWAGCVREAIHAVESTAVKLAPEASTLGKALLPLQRSGLINGRLQSAFEKLYAYTNDEKGVRHALVFDDAESSVDEADALFMLGACASFVSYLLARSQQLASD